MIFVLIFALYLRNVKVSIQNYQRGKGWRISHWECFALLPVSLFNYDEY